jgi:hypothetical protein
LAQQVHAVAIAQDHVRDQHVVGGTFQLEHGLAHRGHLDDFVRVGFEPGRQRIENEPLVVDQQDARVAIARGALGIDFRGRIIARLGALHVGVHPTSSARQRDTPITSRRRMSGTAWTFSSRVGIESRPPRFLPGDPSPVAHRRWLNKIIGALRHEGQSPRSAMPQGNIIPSDRHSSSANSRES